MEKTCTALVKRHLKDKNELWEENSGKQLKNFNLETNKTRSSRGEQERNFLVLVTGKVMLGSK